MIIALGIEDRISIEDSYSMVWLTGKENECENLLWTFGEGTKIGFSCMVC